MKRAQLSGAVKRKLAKKKKEETSDLKAKTPKLTTFFSKTPEEDTQTPGPGSPSSGVDANPVNFTLNALDEAVPSSSCYVGDGSESNVMPINDNEAEDPGLWLQFSAVDVSYWIARGPSDCQHHKGPFDKSTRHFSKGILIRRCSKKLFVGTKANGEKYKREWLMYSPSTGSVYCFVCKLFAPSHTSSFVTKEGFSDWRNTVVIYNHEKSSVHRDSMLTYLARRKGVGLGCQLKQQIQEECDYWEHVLRRVVAVIRTLAERGLAFRGTEEKFGSLKNGNFLGLIELVSQFDPFLASHIVKYGNAGKGNPSYLSKTICDEIIQIMAQNVHAFIVDEIKSSGYFSISVESTPDLSHIDQLSVVVRYLKDGQPIERFLTFLELKSHTGDEIAKQVLQYLGDTCHLDFSKCRGQSYDNAANMSGRYKGMQQKILEVNRFAIYIPCAAHSLNLVGRSSVDCCQEAVKFFSTVQVLYTFFSASTGRWKILKDCIGSDCVLKSLSETRWEAHAAATSAILTSFSNILDALECIADDDTQKGDTKREANSIADKIQELEFVFMLQFWNEILSHFHRVSQALQKEDVDLKTCADLYLSLCEMLCISRDEFERYETAAKKMVPGVDYRAVTARKRVRKRLPNDGDAPDANFNARDFFRVATFLTIVDNLEAQMKKRGEVYGKISERFSFLNDLQPSEEEEQSSLSHDIDRTERHSQCCQQLIEAYPNDFNNDFTDEIEQFHSYVRQKMVDKTKKKTKLSHATLYKILVDDSIENVFPNVDVAFRIFLTLMVTNCSAERSFSQLKHIKNPYRTSMLQERLDALSLLCIEADLLRNICFEDVIKDFASKKSRKKLFK